MSEELATANTPSPRLSVFRSVSDQDIFRIEIDNGTYSTSVLNFPLNEIQAIVAVPPMTVQILARKILDWIERTRDETSTDMNASETYVMDTIDVLVDDIEALCREQLKKEGSDAK